MHANLRFMALCVAAAAALHGTTASASCGAAFCALNTMWSTQGVPADAGTARLDMRYEYVNQNQLLRGRHRISQAEDDSDTTERRTVNENLVTTLDYAFSRNWAVSASVPIVHRVHSHVADPMGAATEESWRFTKVADARVLGLYRFDNEKNPLVSYGLTFGVKLPTGDHRVRNSDGALAERALQPGSGSTDLVLGGFFSGAALTMDSSWWVQALVQQAVQTKDNFKPGNQYQLNLGYRHPFDSSFRGLLQLNTLVKGRDSGEEAEPELSGSKTVFLSPGLSYSITRDAELYGFFQLPIYRYVNGIQLSASSALVFGITTRF